jgi:HEAT repeat protein
VKIWTILLLLASLPAGAAVTSKRDIPEVSLKELLSMPERNREVVAQSQKNPNLYTDLIKLAFSKDEDFQYRWKALTLAANLGGAQAADEIKKACDANEWFMKNACLISLQKIDIKKAQEASKKLLSDKALVVRSAAVRVFSTNLTPPNRDVLWEEMGKSYNFAKKQSLWIRSEILDVLSKRPEQSELNQFAQSLKDTDSRLHVYAVRALEKISHKVLGSEKATLSAKRDLWLKRIK